MLIGIALISFLLLVIFYPRIALSTTQAEAAAETIVETVVAEEPVKAEPPTIPELIDTYAAQFKVDARLAHAIAKCESKLIPTAKNPRSTASGVFQFLKGSWNYYGLKYWGSMEGKDVFNAEQNIELAMYVMSKRGAKDWEASRYCWD